MLNSPRKYSTIPLDDDTIESASKTQPLLEENNESSRPSLANELCKVTSSVTPNDFLVSLGFFLAALYVANLKKYSENDDGAELAFITVVSHTCIRIIAQGFQLPAGFKHIGFKIDPNTHQLHINQKTFTNSIAAMIKVGVLSSIPAAAFLAATPLLYQLSGTPKTLVEDSYAYIPFACASLILQNCNVGFQQTLLQLGKKNRMLQAAFLNALFICTPILLVYLLGNPIKNISPLSTLGLIFLIGNLVVTLNHLRYFKKRGHLPNFNTYYHAENIDEIAQATNNFVTVGFNIFLQLLSELGAVYVQPFTARLCLPKKDLGSALALLNATSNLNVFTVVPGITGSLAASSAITRPIQCIEHGNTEARHCDDLRTIISTASKGLFVFSTIINIGLLTSIAPIVANLFYHTNAITIAGLSNNPYAVIGFTGLGTTIDYDRNLELFVTRPLGLDAYGTFISYVCLWLVNPLLVAGFSQINDIGVFAILAPYYTSILVGDLLLKQRRQECTRDDNTLQALINANHNNHEAVLSKMQRCFPSWLSMFDKETSKDISNARTPLLRNGDE